MISNIRLAIFGLSVLLAAIPAGAQNSSRTTHLFKDPDAAAYRSNSLPCSTARVSAAFASGSNGPLQQLEQIERASVNALKSSSDHGSNGRSPLYRPVSNSGRQPTINFVYHAIR